MAIPLQVFVCEFITGGGLGTDPLPAGLAREGDMMLRRVLEDLADTGRVGLTTTRDPRMPPLDLPVTVIHASPTESIWDQWQQCMQRCDAVLPIAPETGGVLERLSRLVLANGKLLMGSTPLAVRIAANKLATAKWLARHGIPTVPTFPLKGPIPSSPHGWVVKPDDGAGCEDTYYIDTLDQLEPRALRRANAVVQPYLHGIAASASLLCLKGQAWLLACNRQRVECKAGRLRCTGIEVNALAGYQQDVQAMIAQIACALPGLRAYVGIDLVITARGPVVMEINPRLTTAYVGLRDCMEINPGALLLELLIDGKAPPEGARAHGSYTIALTYPNAK